MTRAAIEGLFVDLFLDAHAAPPPQITLDLDATDDPLHGHQEERFFHGYYDNYCYLPLYVFCGRHLLAAKLRPANIDASAGSIEEVARIVARIRQRWPRVRILLRADFGFCPRGADGVVREQRRRFLVRPGQERAPQRRDRDRTRRGPRAEPTQRQAGPPLQGLHLADPQELEPASGGSSPRRNGPAAKPTRGLSSPRWRAQEHEARHLYEKLYCARGEMENRIKECQLDLYADRTSAHTMRANQLRLWFASMAYVLICALRRIGLKHTQFARASCGTIRLKLLKIGALVRTSVRRIKLAMPSAFPYQAEYRAAHAALTAAVTA